MLQGVTVMADKRWSIESTTLPSSTLTSPTIAAEEIDLAGLSLDDWPLAVSPSSPKGKERMSLFGEVIATHNQTLDISVLV